jgi:ChrR Cupin-like domain
MTNLSFIQEYAAGHALAILEDLDKAEYELINVRELQVELLALSVVVSDLAYGVPLVPLPLGLISDFVDFLPEILVQRLDRTDARPANLLELMDWSVTDLRQVAKDLHYWEPFPMPTGSERVIWQVDEQSAQVAFFLNIPVAGSLPHHWHASGESILVLKGDFINDDGTVFEVGDRIVVAADTSHQPTTSLGCLILAVTSLHDKILANKH